MLYIAYGALGVIAVLVLLGIGAVLGWTLKSTYDAHTRKVAEDTRTDEQKRQFKEDQEAFEAMMHYNTDIAYGLDNSLEKMFKE